MLYIVHSNSETDTFTFRHTQHLTGVLILRYVSELWEDLHIIRAYQASYNHTFRMCDGES